MQTLNETIRKELTRAKDRLRSLVPPERLDIQRRLVNETKRAELRRQIESLERIKQRAEGTL